MNCPRIDVIFQVATNLPITTFTVSSMGLRNVTNTVSLRVQVDTVVQLHINVRGEIKVIILLISKQ